MEHADSCGIVARIRKDGIPTHGTLKRTLEALVALGHRGGEIEGEGDGAGVLVDLPRELWARRLVRAGRREEAVRASGFFVAHVLIPRPLRSSSAAVKSAVRNLWAGAGLEILVEAHHPVSPEVLGPRAREDEPEFWQVAGIEPLHADPTERDAFLDGLARRTEDLGVHVASLAADRCVYKVHGSPALLRRYYPDLRSPLLRTVSAVGHSRYSTNTLPTVLRAQPFPCLAHNGEINTIERLRREARALGAQIPPGGSDSQDLDRILRFLIHRWGLTLAEAVELLFPPVHHQILHSPEVLRSLYAAMRRTFDASAQGPAALILRHGDEFVFSVDALGLRPLWVCETTREIVATSEPGVVPVEELETDPKPMAPGEKVAVRFTDGRASIVPHSRFQKEVLARFARRIDLDACWASLGLVRGERTLTSGTAEPRPPSGSLDERKARAGWTSHDEELLDPMVRDGSDPVGSMGWDGPLAALDPDAVLLADFLQEDVAVVTNPAIDPKREGEHFSTRVRLGARLEPGAEPPYPPWVSVEIPLLLAGVPDEGARRAARKHETALLADVVAHLGPERVRTLPLTRDPARPLADDLEILADEACRAAEGGAHLLVLADPDDGPGLDPLLAVAEADRALRARPGRAGGCPRRRTSLVVASDALRNLHDCMCCLGLGADALAPWLLFRAAWEARGAEGLDRLLTALTAGMRTVISTMGIHEISGYGRVFSALGLGDDLARRLGVRNRFGGSAGLTLDELDRRWARLRKAPAKSRPFRATPRLARWVRAVAEGGAPYRELAERAAASEAKRPVALRHLLDLRVPDRSRPVDPDRVDPSVGGHRYPIFICPMSFGSQGETAFRIYAEAGRRVGIPCMNGEGGELPDLLGRYRAVRSQQVASGRFGVHADMLNSVDLIEIKIGQGAKPGEGGHLPGAKVTEKVARARSAVPGISLISPSNHHDVYSIEDLAQLIEELRTVNPRARISVKVPVVSGIATIGLGVVKAGADILTLSGFDGGTGAARLHALRRVGLPVEVGIAEVHDALVEAGLRDRVELWADGGLRTAADVVKCLCLGADRAGFGTLALLGIGCIACRRCHRDVCPRGIATQVETPEDAARRGIRGFEPRDPEQGVENLVRLLRETGEEVRRLAARLGLGRVRDLVGRRDLLVQARGTDRVDLSALLVPAGNRVTEPKGTITVRRPLSYLTRVVTQEITSAVDRGAGAVVYEDDRVLSSDRALGTHLSGEAVRRRPGPATRCPWQARLHLGPGSVPGNGMGAFNVDEVEIRVEGGSQDGVAKCARGGRVVVLKGENHDGQPVGGCVGKGFAYGAQAGLFLVQGDADSRCGVRLSGADVVIGGRMREPRVDALGFLADRANLKGFAFEYMTAGRAVVLGDPGPWLCSGMTGGVVYVRLDPGLGLDRDAVQRRLALGSPVEIRELDERGEADLRELLGAYAAELRNSPYTGGEAEARWVEGLLQDPARHFVALRPPTEAGRQP
ncbi:MAG: glutamate synthase [Deltaproteobacteria bacterium]|nr:glutamate synthase [Deltaproteobacteria bacterium]